MAWIVVAEGDNGLHGTEANTGAELMKGTGGAMEARYFVTILAAGGPSLRGRRRRVDLRYGPKRCSSLPEGTAVCSDARISCGLPRCAGSRPHLASALHECRKEADTRASSVGIG
jgi:hypothetical protein